MGATKYLSTTGSDANNGTTSALAKLTWTAGLSLLAAGDTLRVLPGSYSAVVYVSSAFANGTSASPITVVSDTKWGAFICPPGSGNAGDNSGSGNNAAFEIRRNSWVFDGFVINGSSGYSGGGNTWTINGTEWYIGFYATGVNVIGKNLILANVCRSSAGVAIGGAGTVQEYFYGGSAIQILNCIVHDCGPPSSNTHVHGIYNATQNVTIMGNLVYRNSSDNITSWHASDQMHVANNTCFGAYQGAGILIGAGDSGVLAGGNHNCRVFNNICYDNPVGIIEEGTIGAGNVYNNNCVFSNTTNWSLPTTGGSGSATVTSNPQFVNYIKAGGGDYHLLSASPCINTGTISCTGVASLVIDIDGVTRPSGANIDIGAYEFNGTIPPPNSPTAVTVGRLRHPSRHKLRFR